jgi:hypothetical protein
MDLESSLPYSQKRAAAAAAAYFEQDKSTPHPHILLP